MTRSNSPNNYSAVEEETGVWQVSATLSWDATIPVGDETAVPSATVSIGSSPVQSVPSPSDETQASIARAIEAARELGDQTFLTRREMKYLPSMLLQSEKVLRLVSGTFKGNTWLVALTDQRILCINSGMFYGVEHRSIYLNKVSAISGKLGLVLGKIFIRDSAGDYLLENVHKASVNPFVAEAQVAIRAAQASPTVGELPGVAEEISKLHGLLEGGALTQSEFAAAKKRLLEK